MTLLRPPFANAVLMFLVPALLIASTAIAGEWGWEEAGVRVGFSRPGQSDFRQYELFSAYRLPWDWRGSSGWGMATRVNTDAGILADGEWGGFIGSIGPGLVLDKRESTLAADIGINIVILGRHSFIARDFDGPVQFISHIGLSYRMSRHLAVGYRIQHMSHGNIYHGANPGLDMHVACLSWRF